MKLSFPNGDHGDVVIERGTLSLGSAAGNDVVLETEGVADSHARLSMEADGLYLRPVDEADVYVNGRRIHDRTKVTPGDVVGVHKVQVRLKKLEGDESAEGGGRAEPSPDPTRVRPAVTDWQLRGVSGDSFGRVVPLQGRMTVGRGEGCDIVLEATEVSRQHAALEVEQEGVLVEDLDSSNGTFVNGERIKDKKRAGRGDEIAFDKLRFRVEMATRTETARRPPPSRQPARPAPEPPKRQGNGAMVWVVLAGVLVIAGAAAAWYLELFQL